VRTSAVIPPALQRDDSESLMLALHDNHGVIGALYADYIVRHKAWVKETVEAVRKYLKASCKFTSHERFWENVMVTILAGAHVANTAGLTKFNVGAIEEYLTASLTELRDSASAKLYGMLTAASGEELLSELLNDLRGEHMIVTDTVPLPTIGRPVGVVGVSIKGDPIKLKDVWLQLGDHDGRILIRVKPLYDWLYKHKTDPKRARREFEKDYVITQGKYRVGVGVGALAGIDKLRAECWDMTPKVPPPPPTGPSRSPSSPSSNFGSP